MKKQDLTPYSNVNEILNILLAEAQDILKEQFFAMYLFVSLSSDITF